MATNENSPQSLKRFTSLCRGIPFSKMWSGAAYGAEANIYRPADVAEMELSSTQCLLLALLHSLVAGDIVFCTMLADICHQVEKLRSRHYRLWLLEDFVFPQPDIQKAMTLLAKLIADGAMKLPPHVMGIMSALTNKYGITDVQLRTLSEEGLSDLANQLKNAVANNSPGDIIAITAEGGDINGSTHSGDNLVHLAAKADKFASIAALSFLKADLEAVNTSNASPLLEAVKCNHAASVKALLMVGVKVDRRFYRGDTYLHVAAAKGSNAALEVLLDRGLEVNKKNYFNETPLVQAVRAGNVRGVEMLLARGADSTIVPEGEETLTEMVLESQNPDMLKAFIKNGVDVKSKDGDTVLHLIARSGNVEMLKVIKNIKLLGNIKNQNGLTALHFASDPSIVRMLIGMGADVNAKTGKGETALHFASAKGSLELVRTLIQLGAVVDLQDDRGTSALMLACANSKENIATFLLFNGANPKLQDNGGRISLHYAAEGGCVEMVTALLDAGVKVDYQDKKGDTPAFIVAANNPTVLKLLVESGADLALRDHNGDGIIHHVARNGHTEVMTTLFGLRVEVDMRGEHESTALHLAARGGHTSVVAALLDSGAEVGAKDEEGYTPLMLASNQGHLSLVQLLIERGAALNDRDKNGQTAVHWARTNGQKARAVFDYLKSIGGIQ
ncbi:putative ankyrin repeat protein RF_0381 [Halyomorpha halys]|uniref:putative ankyrin repeat protein RF_0381 n=1 Tax=Halyomorpha halys TaxID=286706 RepID=UPI0006D4FC6E|nr:uncharacterized protein LOC106681430 [Halyomorpha halys]